MVQRVDLQHIKDVLLRPALRLTLAPFAHLDAAQVVRCVDISILPFARHLSLVFNNLIRGSQTFGVVGCTFSNVLEVLLKQLVRVVLGDLSTPVGWSSVLWNSRARIVVVGLERV